ncbi:unnamed protein product [Amoebophrya sp. A25]|nr:unnamed protein product [Amoebophrya sp. A25]|eukprot:GSA25T00000583001.1
MSTEVSSTKAGEDNADDDRSLIYYKWDWKSAPFAAPTSKTKNARAIVCLVFHGLHSHGRYGHTSFMAESCLRVLDSHRKEQETQHQKAYEIAVYSVDLPGHGEAKGTRGLLQFPDCVDHAVIAARAVWKMHADAEGGIVLHLMGSSMGGSIAVLCAARLEKEMRACGSSEAKPLEVASVILSAPLVKVRNPPSSTLVGILQGISWVAPSLAILSAPTGDPSWQYRDPVRCAACAGDSLEYSGRLRLGSGETAIMITRIIPDEVAALKKTGMLVLAPTDERIVDGDATMTLCELATNLPDSLKRLHCCPLARHGVFGEPPDALLEIEMALSSWIAKFQ